MTFYPTIGKRLIDFIASGVLILVTLPIQLIIGIILLFYRKGKILFIQTRPGKHEQLFSLIKFKTMNDATDSDGNLLSDEERTDALGSFLRKYGLDELPQLFLVLIGKMSLVGPRPLLTEYLEKYPAIVRKRHNVKPGISGWAQVNGGNLQTWEERFDHDLWYVNHVSFSLDIKILWRTLTQKSQGDVVMEKYS